MYTVNQLLQNSEVKCRRLFETACDGILILSAPSGAITDANPYILYMLGYTLPELLDKELWQIGSPTDQRAAHDHFSELLAKGYVRYENIPLQTKSGQPLHVEVVGNVYRVDDQQVIQCNIRDITDRKRADIVATAYHDNMVLAATQIITVLSKALFYRDPYTSLHQKRVSDLSVAIGNKLCLAKDCIEGLRFAALIHDIGKIGVPIDILTKPTKLEPYEHELLRNHVKVGYDIIRQAEFPWPLAKALHQHHERLDGSGYPLGLKAEQIIIEARILGVADSVDAIANDRPYRRGLGILDALKIIKHGRGITFDESVVNACLVLFEDDGYHFAES
jgi:PAS domain S-box-containing protein